VQVRHHRHVGPDSLGGIVQWREVMEMQNHWVGRTEAGQQAPPGLHLAGGQLGRNPSENAIRSARLVLVRGMQRHWLVQRILTAQPGVEGGTEVGRRHRESGEECSGIARICTVTYRAGNDPWCPAGLQQRGSQVAHYLR
jgi:hypothetical protein